MSPEVEIAILIAVLYLFECALLLYSNEVVIECSARGCRALFPSERANFCGRLLYFLNPVAPVRAYYRVMWHTGAAAHENGNFTAQIELAKSLSGLAPFVLFTAVVVLVGLPISLIFFQIRETLPIWLLTYAAVAALLLRLWSMRAQLALSRSRFTSLAFQCIACPPFAPNIVRAISLAATADVDLLVVAKTNFSVVERRHLYRTVIERVEAQIGALEPDSPECFELENYLTRVRQELLSLDHVGKRRKTPKVKHSRPRINRRGRAK